MPSMGQVTHQIHEKSAVVCLPPLASASCQTHGVEPKPGKLGGVGRAVSLPSLSQTEGVAPAKVDEAHRQARARCYTEFSYPPANPDARYQDNVDNPEAKQSSVKRKSESLQARRSRRALARDSQVSVGRRMRHKQKSMAALDEVVRLLMKQEEPLLKLADPIAQQQNRKVNRAVDWWKLSKKIDVPVDVLKQAAQMFKQHAVLPQGSDMELINEMGILRDGRLDRSHFEDVDPKSRGCLFGGGSVGGKSDFAEFAIWFWSRGFSENVLCNDATRSLRDIARRHKLSYCTVEAYKRAFDSFDTDGSGEIEFHEFAKLIPVLAKVPAGLEMPPNRLKYLWSLVNIDGNGVVDFEEFVVFYKKYFDAQEDGTTCPFKEFYARQARLPCLR